MRRVILNFSISNFGINVQSKKMKKLSIAILFCQYLLNAAFSQAPAWSVNPAAYANSMSFICQVYLDGTPENTPGNLLGAFVGNQVRGVATPVVVGSGAYYFLTVYSNVVSGETIHFKVLLAGSSTPHPAAETAVFMKNGQLGGFPAGYALHISAANDFPISLSPMPVQNAWQGEPLAILDLDDYLLSQDNDPVTWSVAGNAHLSASLGAGNLLVVSAIDPAWTGTASIAITATETGTTHQYSASGNAVFVVHPNYGNPVFNHLPRQFVQSDLPLPSGDMDDRLDYEGPCLEYSVHLNLPEGEDPLPFWIQPTTNSGSMTLVVEVQSNCHATGAPGDKLAGYVDGQLAGVASAHVAGDKFQFFLTLANLASGSISFRYYDAGRHFLHEKSSALSFLPGETAGTAAAPVVMEIAPIKVSVSPTGEWATTVLDPAWAGIQTGWFYAADCSDETKRDSAEAVFIVNKCPAQSLDLDSMPGFCLRAIDPAASIVWYKNSAEAGVDSTLGVFEPGIYHYEALNQAACAVITGCPVVVDVAEPMNLASVISTHDVEDCTQLFLAPTIHDISPPHAVCQAAAIYLDENGAAFLPAQLVDGGSYASCGIDSIWVSKTGFLCENIGLNEVMLTVLDSMGRLDSCMAAVYVKDTVPPVARCKHISILLEEDGSYRLNPMELDNGSTDNCAIAAMRTDPPGLYCREIGGNTVTLYASDASGNVGSCTATVTVQPFFTVENIIITNETPGAGNGAIQILATSIGGQMGWSINGANSWQLVNHFKNLTHGAYHTVIAAFGTYGCVLDLGVIELP
jgi:hypothetical protein